MILCQCIKILPTNNIFCVLKYFYSKHFNVEININNYYHFIYLLKTQIQITNTYIILLHITYLVPS